MEEQLKRLEEGLQQLTIENRQLMEQLRAENQQLREQISALEKQLRPPTPAEVAAQVAPPPAAAKTPTHRVALSVIASIALVPVLLYFFHNGIATTAATAVSALVAYFLGPVALRLLMEGLMRAIPNVLFGQATRLALERWKNRSKAG